MKSKIQISILGCGWLGLPLAEHLKQLNYQIKGSTTRKEKLENLEQKDILPYQLELSEKKISGNVKDFLKGSEILILNIPPGLRKQANKNHFKEIDTLLSSVKESDIKYLLFIGSTSVFEDHVTFPSIENSSKANGSTKSAQQLIAVEELLKGTSKFNLSILRFGGLFDETRHPAKFLAGKTGLSNPKAPINLIHKLDCIALITKIIQLKAWGHVFNAAFPYHPSKEAYYKSYCIQNKLSPPEFNLEGNSIGKIISSDKTEQYLLYRLRHQP